MLVSALFRSGHVPVDAAVRALHALQHAVVQPHAGGGQLRDIAVLHIHHVPGMPDDGRGVGGDEGAPLSEAEEQRRVLPRGDQAVALPAAEDAEGVRALDPAEHLRHRPEDILPVVVILQQLGHHLAVGIRGEAHALPQKKILDLQIIFDNAVVHQGDLPVLGHMGMGIHVVGLPVGGPAGMADADAPLQRAAVLRQRPKRLEPPLALAHLQTPARRIHREAGGVIPPVFQPLQSVQQNGRSLFRARISNNTAHKKSPSDFGTFFQSRHSGAQSAPFFCRDLSCQSKGQTRRAFALSPPVTAPLFCGRPHISDCVTRPEWARESIRRIFDHSPPRRPAGLSAPTGAGAS